MVAVVSSNPTGGSFIFYFLKPSMSILYRNIRFVLKTKNPDKSLKHDLRSIRSLSLSPVSHESIAAFLSVTQETVSSNIRVFFVKTSSCVPFNNNVYHFSASR